MRVGLLLLFLVVLSFWGSAIDQAESLGQTQLFAALQLASLGGTALGVALAAQRFKSVIAQIVLAVGALVVWRIAYFPIMVFSGHVASIGEWMQLGTGLPVAVYPVFLCAVALLHVIAVVAFSWLTKPPHPGLYAALVPAFAVAVAVSFSDARDTTWLPDHSYTLEEEIPDARAGVANPYLPALAQPGYALQQRVMLMAAGITYATIPPSPWATTVKAVLEGQFEENPVASTADRVREHYLAYHSAHRFIGCASFRDCPLELPVDDGSAEEAPDGAPASPEPETSDTP